MIEWTWKNAMSVSLRRGLNAIHSQEPEVQAQNNFPGHGNACGYSTRRAEWKDTIRTGAFAVLVGETIKASDQKLLKSSTLWSSLVSFPVSAAFQGPEHAPLPGNPQDQDARGGRAGDRGDRRVSYRGQDPEVIPAHVPQLGHIHLPHGRPGSAQNPLPG